MVPSEVEKLFRAFAEERKRALPQFTPDGIPITLENKFDDAIYNYLYKYWKEQSGEYDPKDDEIIMTKESSFTKNEKKFEQWLFAQYGMTNKEQREYTFKGNLLSLGEIALSAWAIEGAGARKLVVPRKFLASNADDTAKNVAKQESSEVVEEVIENTAKKNIINVTQKVDNFIKDENTSGKLFFDGKSIDSLDGLKLSDLEKKTWKDLLRMGNDIDLIPVSEIQGQKAADSMINGIRTELKAMSGSNQNTVIKRIEQCFKKPDTKHALIDVRNGTITAQQAKDIINSALRMNKIPEEGIVVIWINEGFVIYQ